MGNRTFYLCQRVTSHDFEIFLQIFSDFLVTVKPESDKQEEVEDAGLCVESMYRMSHRTPHLS